MARYSPRDPGFTAVPGFFDALTHIAGEGAEGFTGVRADQEARARQDEEDRIRDEELAIDRHRRGFIGRDEAFEDVDVDPGFSQAPVGLQRTEHEAPSIFRGQGVGMQPARPGMDRVLDSIAMREPEPEPQVLALPGAYVEGMGFTDRAITDQDVVQATRARAAAAAPPRRRMREGVEQVTDDVFFDPARSPEGREAAAESQRDAARRARLERALGALQGGEDISPELQAELLELDVPSSQVFPDDDEESDVITRAGRDFPNTAAGEAAALEWERALAEARRAPGAGDDDPTVTTRRALAMAASRAVGAIDDEIRGMGLVRGRALPDRTQSQLERLNRDRDAALRAFGFRNIQELESEMRALRVSEGAGAPAAEPSSGVAPVGSSGQVGSVMGEDFPVELIDSLIIANPDASPEEILQLAQQRMARAGGR